MPQIRDPIHGAIDVSGAEVRLIDAAPYQRLRNIKQLGFTDFAFPGGTHTRYAHGIGAMAVATKIFDSLAASLELPAADVARFRQGLRLAVLFHDVGHAPLSHASETIMPSRASLKLPAWTGSGERGAGAPPASSATGGGTPTGRGPEDRRANHEDYTLKVLLDSEIARILEDEFADAGLPPAAIAALIADGVPPGSDGAFVARGVDWAPLLRQIVSSELDADRMDYLQRDSFHTGVHYGQFDLEWLAHNLTARVADGRAHLALGKRAIFAFEDFLLSRFHMFLSVYYHYTPICFDNMLQRYYKEAAGEYVIPSDVESYLHHDDVLLTHVLRESKNRWAQAIVRRRPWRMVAEVNEFDRGYDLDALVAKLAAEGIEAFRSESKGILSKYFRREHGDTLYVHDSTTDRYTPIDEYTPLYERYAKEVRLMRVYVEPEKYERAAKIARG